MKKKVMDMTTGSPFWNLLRFSLPIALGFALQNLYSLGDSFIVAFSRGADAATGVNLTGTLTFLVLGFSQGISAGFGVMLSRYVGAKDEVKLRNSLAVSLVLGVTVSLVLSAVAAPLSRPFLQLLNTPERFIDAATGYIQAIFIGLLFNTLYNLTDQIMRAMGDSKTPLFILILSACLNLGLNSLLFVTELPPSWAGWATVISQAVCAAVGFVILFVKFPVLRLKRKDFRFSARFALRHLAVGIPMALQFSVTAIGTMIQQRAFNSLGADFAQAQSTASKVDNIFGSLLSGCGTAMAVYCGQNYGAKKIDRIKKGFFAALGVGAIYTAFSMAGNLLLCRPLAYVLLGEADPLVYDYIFQYILTQSCCYYFLFLVFMPRQAVQSVGYSALAIAGGVIELAMRAFAAFALAVWFGFDGACFSNPLAWLGGAVFFVLAFFVIYRKLEKRQKSNDLVID